MAWISARARCWCAVAVVSTSKVGASAPALGPLQLSPRRSFAAWSEIVRGTALPWSGAELALGRAIGASLIDIIVQVSAVRLLVAEHQLAGIRATVHSSQEPVAIADSAGRLLFANAAFAVLLGCSVESLAQIDDVALAFTEPQAFLAGLDATRQRQQAWRSELALVRHCEPGQAPGDPVPVGVRAELVLGRDGQVLGTIVVLADLSDSRRADQARHHLEQSLQRAGQGGRSAQDNALADPLIGAILSNASLAAMDIADSAAGPTVAPLLEEVEASAHRATALYARIRQLSGA